MNSEKMLIRKIKIQLTVNQVPSFRPGTLVKRKSVLPFTILHSAHVPEASQNR